MKVKALALAMAAVSVGANAANYTAGNNGVTEVVRISGASASDNLLFNSVLTNLIDATQPIILVNPPTITGAAPNQKIKLGNFWSIIGTTKASGFAATNAAAQGQTISFVKRSAGGSAYGVQVLANASNGGNPSTVASVDLTNVTLGAAGSYTINGVTFNYTSATAPQETAAAGNVSDAGISDVNPALFTGINTPKPASLAADDQFVGFTSADVGKLSVAPVAAQVFGIIVNNSLYNALAKAQGTWDAAFTTFTPAAQPSLSKQFLSSAFTGTALDWSKVFVTSGPFAGQALTAIATAATDVAGHAIPAANVYAAPTNTSIKIARRTQGSGTQATFNRDLFQQPLGAGLNPLAANTPNVSLGAGSGDVDVVLTAWQNGTAQRFQTDFNGGDTGTVNNAGAAINNPADGWRTVNGAATDLPGVVGATSKTAWAIGINGLEKTGTSWKFIKVDGVAPSVVTAHDGLYPYWSENTVQYRNDAFAPTAVKKAFIDEMVLAASKPASLAIENSFLTSAAYLALSSNGNAPDLVYTATNPVIGYTHNGDNAKLEVYNTAYKATPGVSLGF